jgi:glucose-6-phosphate dehydrogenase assembly protein OpcA
LKESKVKFRRAKTYAVEELSEDTLKAIASSKMDSRHKHLNALLDEQSDTPQLAKSRN